MAEGGAMIRRWPWAPVPRVGIALDRERLVAVVPGDAPAEPWIRLLIPPGDSDNIWPDLAAALGELRTALAGGQGDESGEEFSGELHVVLLPPLGELRRVDLPGLSVAEARQVLRREPSRYLARPAEVAPLELEVEGEGWRQQAPFTLFAAPAAIVEGMHAAARESGWRLGGIVPAEGAWGAAAAPLLPPKHYEGRALVICLDGRVEIIRVETGRAPAVRRFPAGTTDVVSLVQSALRGTDASPRTGVAVVGDSPLADELRLTLAGFTERAQPDAGQATWSRSPALLAARFAPRALGPRLLPDSERAMLQRKAKRANVVRFATAAALLIAAAALQLWGLSREHDAIVAERVRLREPVTRALAVRDSLGQVANRLATIRSASTTAPRWAPLLVALSARLPDDAFLLSLRADGDSLRLEGEAARAEGAFDALRRVQGLAALRPDGPIRQQIAEDGSTSERFTLSARVVRGP